MLTEEQARRFWSKVRVDESGCWLWTGHVNKDGYGLIAGSWFKGTRLVHRLAWLLIRKQLSSAYLCHTCDVRTCCNPDHLFEGTPAQNILDCVSKDRHARGSRNANHKLSEAQVLEIRRLAEIGTSSKELATRFSVSRVNINYIVARTAWKHI